MRLFKLSDSLIIIEVTDLIVWHFVFKAFKNALVI
jgi:hypothetical protein